jgi:hypothetical protein
MTTSLTAWLAASLSVLTACGSDGKMEEDGPLAYEQATIFEALASSVSADHTLMSFSGEGHGFSPDGIRLSLDTALDFLDRHLD